MPFRAFHAIAMICLVALAGPVRAEGAPGTASDAIKAFDGELLDVMKNAKTLGLRGRYEKLEPAVQKAFDLPFMTKLSIGPSWGRLTPDQKQRAAQAFGRYVTATYANRFDGYSGQQWPVLGETKIKHGVLVRTQIVQPNEAPVSINYVLHDNDQAWQIRDVYLGGSISELATRRSEFTGILRNQGVDGLIAVLNKKADALTG